jgi:hypothetical protein
MQHFANFALGDTELGNLNRQAYEKAKKTGDRTQYKQMQAQQRQAFDSNRQNAQAGVQAKRAAAAEAKRVAGLGVVGKAKHYGGKAIGAAAPWVGGLTTAAMVLPALGSVLPQRQPQPEQEPPY